MFPSTWPGEFTALYFNPQVEEFAPRPTWSLSNAFTSAFKELDPIPQSRRRQGLHPFWSGRQYPQISRAKPYKHARGSSPTSSSKIVPPSEDSKRPSRFCNAPVKAPFSCPNNSDAISDGGIAAQLTRMKARFARFDRLWIARAINSLPVLVSPCISTVESVGATFEI